MLTDVISKLKYLLTLKLNMYVYYYHCKLQRIKITKNNLCQFIFNEFLIKFLNFNLP